MVAKSSPTHRRTVAKESFQNAAECIGKIEKGLSLFAVTRGQFSMLDAILHCLDCVGAARISVWTWVIADYEVERFSQLMTDGRLLSALLVVDGAAREKNAKLLSFWKSNFGADSVRYVRNHAKIATIETDEFRLLLRGSMNLNFNPRFEQLDVSEGCPAFDLVREIERSLPILADIGR